MIEKLEWIEVAGIKWATENLEVAKKRFFSFNEAISLCSAGWRVPTQAEFQQLVEQCDYSFVDGFGVFTDRTSGSQLRLPIDGCRGTAGVYYGQGYGGYYWSSWAGSSYICRFHKRGASHQKNDYPDLLYSVRFVLN